MSNVSSLGRKPKRSYRKGISPASPAQRAKVKEENCIVCGEPYCDPAHIVPRSLRGCDSPLCVVPLCRPCHRLYDLGEIDLEPYLIGDHIEELQHALIHTEGSLTRLLRIIEANRRRLGS